MDQRPVPKFSVTSSSVNKDSLDKTREDYLKMVRDFKTSYPAPVVEEVAGVTVVREDLLECGGKARLGEALVASVREKTIVYVQPRYGFAAISLVDLCKKYNKKLVLFMPSSKLVSDHQAFTIEHGAEPHFHRVAAMKNLNSMAKLWARQHGGFFIPLGLDHPLVTAMIVKTASEIEEPMSFWTAVSTGVLTRGLQIAWPNATSYGIAVSRNIQEGERGSCEVIPSYYSFEQDSRDRPPFPSASNYDAKVWEYLIDGDLFWNVAGEIKTTIDKTTIKSERQWQS